MKRKPQKLVPSYKKYMKFENLKNMYKKKLDNLNQILNVL